jgi:general secretion pathway protein F
VSQALRDSQSQIETGQSVADSLHRHGLCDTVGHRLLKAAERNGQFHHAADAVSRIHAERFEHFIERSTRLVEPILLLAVALLCTCPCSIWPRGCDDSQALETLLNS